jgi:uncharacterized membrane protein
MWLVRGAVKDKERAERILRERAGELTEEERAYLRRVIEEGERVERFLKELEDRQKHK